MQSRYLFVTYIFLAIGSVSLGSHQTIPNDEIAAFLSLKQDDHTIQCIVKYIDKRRRIAKLLIKDVSSPTADAVEFDPDFNHLIRIFSIDLTGDGREELVSLWTHGIAKQIAVHVLTPTARLIFHAIFRLDAIVDLDPASLKPRIKLFSSGGADSPVYSETYVWSSEGSQFIKKESIPETKRNSCTDCFEVLTPSLRHNPRNK